MNLYDDESLKQEVIYLHSLWHLGPPTRNPIPSPNFNPFHDPVQRPRPNYIPPADLQLLSRYGAFTPQISSRNPNYPQNQYNNNKRSRPDSGREWPVNEPVRSPSTRSGWSESTPCKKARHVTEEEKARFALNTLQRDIHRACREFFSRKSGEEDNGSDSDEEDSSSSKEFLSRIFEDKEKLKEHYVKNKESGEFWCLVCGGTGEKSCRKFKSCLALVQHSLNIGKTDLKTQHRALAHVVCNVLGWDVNNPVISSQKESQTLGVEAVVESATVVPPLDTKKPQVMKVEDHAKTAVLQMQKDASEALKDIIAKDSDDSADEDLPVEVELMSRVFSENVELKSYYEGNYEGGDFACLVCCAATDKKMVKIFKHCHGIVKHCVNTPKMKLRAHKAYARFVCQLFGWEFGRLPSRIVKCGAPLFVSNIEKPSSMIEEQMCEDKADNPQNK
ncbi:unnamed protein product [Cochlearia groenlandica]